MKNMDLLSVLKLIWPLILLQLGIALAAIVDIARKKKTRNLSPAVWILISLFVSTIGAILYFVVGRAED